MKQTEITAGSIREAIKALALIKERTTIENVAKYIGVSKMALLKYIYNNQNLIILSEVKISPKSNKTAILIRNAYDSLKDKPYTTEWIAVKREEYKDAIRLDKIENYGQLDYYNIGLRQPEKEYINTVEKINHIIQNVDLDGPVWVHYIGGFGDCAPEEIHGYKVEINKVNEIAQLGYRIVIE